MRETSLPISKNMALELEITALGQEAQGIGRYEGIVIFVPGALSGERVCTRIIKLTSSYAVGRLITLLRPSPERAEPPCPYYAACGGCSIQHMSYPGQLAVKQRNVSDALTRIGGMRPEQIRPILGADAPWRYRNKASFPVGAEERGLVMGLYARRSHAVVDVGDCMIQRPAIMQAMRCVKAWAREYGILPYDERSGTGDLRHVMIRCSAADRVAVTLVTRLPELSHVQELTEALRACVDLAGLTQNINPSPTNVILGKETRTIYGDAELQDSIGEREFGIAPAAFYQVNARQTEKLYRVARDFAGLTGGEILVDAYCGVGTIGQYMADECKEVIGFEIVPEAVENAKHNARRNALSNCRYLVGDANTLFVQLLSQGVSPDVVVVDPPRKGVEAGFIQAAGKSGAKRIVYVSCNPGTLARDVALFRAVGYQAIAAQPVDMFPQTTHVECVVLMSRVENQP